MAGFGEFSGFREVDIHRQQPRYQYEFQQEYILEENPDDDSIKRYIGTGVSIVSLIVENLLSHPFVVLRRQCQVHHNSKKSHLVPITLVPVMVHLHMRQGLTILWKGIGSVCMVKGITLAVEDSISKITSWPKDINNCKTTMTFCKHIFLKSISIAIATPFYCASFVETVQSDIASDKPGFLDVFKDGALRILSWSSPGGRLVPIWGVVIPTVLTGISKYLFTLSFRGIASKILKFRQHHINELMSGYNKPVKGLDESTQLEEIEMNASLTSMIFSEILFYPLETIIHRLYLQGTRTIIDNLDTGNSVLPILTDYEGFFDCYNAIMSQEGYVGLYKGFGALVLQFAVHVAIIKITKCVIVAVAEVFKPTTIKPALTASSSQQSLYSQQKYFIN